MPIETKQKKMIEIFLFLCLLLDPPEIIKRPLNQAVRVGGVASFFCSARGDPVPSIVWRKNGKKVSGTQSRYSVTQVNGQSILRIEPVRAGRDDAPYECVAENGVGDAVSAEATLSVYEGELLLFLLEKISFILLFNDSATIVIHLT